MFHEIARDDVFRLETERLWLRWPQLADAAEIARYSARWEVARFTACIPHPYPKGAAEGFVYAAREGNALGRDLKLVLTPLVDPRRAVGSVSLEPSGAEILTLGYALALEVWGRGLATEAVRAVVDAAFRLTGATRIEASVVVGNAASRRVLEKSGFGPTGRGLSEAPARGAMVECDAFAYARADWARARAPAWEAAP